MFENRCIRCTLPYDFPQMTFKEGLCEVCQKFEKKWDPWLINQDLQAKSKKRLIKILEHAKKKRQIYDCVVGVSGGKDSLYTLYLAVKYGMKPLVIVFDNGFLTDKAKEVIQTACENLKVDYIIYKMEMIYGLYRHFFLNTGTFCTVCVYMIIRGLQRFTRYFNAPLLLVGKSTRLDPVSPRGGNPFFFKNVCRAAGKDIFSAAKFAAGGYFDLFSHYVMGKMIKVPDFEIWDYEHMQNVLKEEMGVDMFREHDDCWAFPMKQYLMIQKYGFGQKFLKATSLVRNGLMSKEEAVNIHHQELVHKNDLPDVSERFLDILNLTMEDLYRAPKISNEKYYSGLGNWLILQRHKLVRGRS